MSWSVSSKGNPVEVKAELERQFAYPLADPPAGLADPGERETVQLVADMIHQCLGTFDPAKTVQVSASGYISFDNLTKTGTTQTVSVSIQPVSG